MSLNCREIDEIIRELDLDGSYIQDVVQPGFDTLALYVYGSRGAKTVFICTAQNACRIHETKRKISRNDKPLRFMEFLKSKIKGAKIESLAQIGFYLHVQFMNVFRNKCFRFCFPCYGSNTSFYDSFKYKNFG